MTEKTGYSATQIGLHWIVALLVAAQYIFKDSIASAWDAYTPGQEVAFSPLILAAMSVSGGLMWFADVQVAAQAHNALKIVLLALILLHVLAIPFHKLVLKNNVMQRMIRPARGDDQKGATRTRPTPPRTGRRA